MSRTDIDAATLADYLRQMCGDGSVEWSYEPMQTSVLLDMADMLDENAKLRELTDLLLLGVDNDMPRAEGLLWSQRVNALAHELGIEVHE